MRRHARKVHSWIFVLCVVGLSSAVADDQPQRRAPSTRFPVVDDETAWEQLPKVEVAEDRRLPQWARVLAGPLPRTTAAMLELDHLYRTSDAFDPRLRAMMRWVASRTNRCTYSQQYAEADLVRLGMDRQDVDRLESRFDTLPARERAALAFARQLTLSGDAITDAEVANLIAAFGEPAVVAMVLQTAYANFQDRLFLALDVAVEPGGPLPPLVVRFVPLAPGETIAAAPRADLALKEATTTSPVVLENEWTALGFDQLRHGMEQQRARPGRISVPAWEMFHSLLPAGLYPADKPTRIKWSLVVMGHQPRLGPAWLQTMRTFGRESKQDRVFEETLFWVITRTIHCYY